MTDNTMQRAFASYTDDELVERARQERGRAGLAAGLARAFEDELIRRKREAKSVVSIPDR